MSTDSHREIAILLTCFNRKALTLAALAALPQAVAGAATWRIVLVDDGSSDGTGDAVAATYPEAIVVRSPGNLYWNGGMRLAWQTALPLKPDFFLWLNDDTELRPNAIADMLALYQASVEPRTIVVGCTIDPVSGEVSYGGYRQVPGLSRLRFRRLLPDDAECDTMNGNCVLFPAAAAVEIGINSPNYRHAYGDNDYGLRARRAGWRIVELKAFVAKQERNRRYEDSVRRLTLANARFILFHPKGVAIREWWRFCRSHGGMLGPVNFLTRYLKMASRGNR